MSLTFESWRLKARDLLIKGVPPNQTYWDESPSLFSFEETALFAPVPHPKVPKEFMELAEAVACARDPERWALLYRLLFRLNHENQNLLNIVVDEDVHKAKLLAKSVRHDIHKMHAFVRFKKADIDGVETYVAWHKPEHLILPLASPFFVRRFGDKPWSIFTPDGSAHWNLQSLSFSEGMPQNEFDHEDPFDEVWKTYYRSIFNPARLKIKMMKAEMSPKYWSSLPETEIIHELIRNTPKRLQDMAEAPRFKAEVPKTSSWEELRTAALSCKACPIAQQANHTVFGEGPLQADLMIVGEQPGDEEDLAGKVFIGPAGQILSQALALAGIDRESIYVTNAVKHFKWTQGTESKARIHKKASGAEMHACKPWLESEIALVKPKVILALGVTAGTALYGRLVQIQSERNKVNTSSAFAKSLTISWHPSAILRAFNDDDREQKMKDLVEDLKKAHHLSQT
ncbi:UdgX family uracil-DNA binding protein [Bdellovibrio sp. HCB117]|uniref:UdgX family uracil-DNA binding protein n=1 Tax=Bdellovibrio sp. HCB117 TaxID=3394359 RepID=UPI0039B5F6FC